MATNAKRNLTTDLYALGYRARFLGADTFALRNPDGVQYKVNPVEQSCSCPSFARGQYCTSDGRTTCKHLANFKALLVSEAGRWGRAAQTGNAYKDAYRLFQSNAAVRYSLGRRIDDVEAWRDYAAQQAGLIVDLAA